MSNKIFILLFVVYIALSSSIVDIGGQNRMSGNPDRVNIYVDQQKVLKTINRIEEEQRAIEKPEKYDISTASKPLRSYMKSY